MYKQEHFTEEQEKWIQSQLLAGHFESREAYIQHLVEREIDNNRKRVALREAIQEGLDSGVSNRSIDEIWEEGIARYKEQNG